jgi:hypothetical protein
MEATFCIAADTGGRNAPGWMPPYGFKGGICSTGSGGQKMQGQHQRHTAAEAGKHRGCSRCRCRVCVFDTGMRSVRSRPPPPSTGSSM